MTADEDKKNGACVSQYPPARQTHRPTISFILHHFLHLFELVRVPALGFTAVLLRDSLLLVVVDSIYIKRIGLASITVLRGLRGLRAAKTAGPDFFVLSVPVNVCPYTVRVTRPPSYQRVRRQSIAAIPIFPHLVHSRANTFQRDHNRLSPETSSTPKVSQGIIVIQNSS